MTPTMSLAAPNNNLRLLTSASSSSFSRLKKRSPVSRVVTSASSSSTTKGTASFASGNGGEKKGKSGTAFMTQTVFDYEAKERAKSASKWINNWKQNYGPVSFELIGKYIFSIAAEACLIGLVLFGVDIVLAAVTGSFGTTSAAAGSSKAAVKAAAAAAAAKAATMTKIRNVFLFFFFAFLALRSRTFSILDASRPKLETEIKMK